jgi:L-tartrate/succinate antiporter
MKSTLGSALLPIVVGGAIALLPVPENLKPNAWYYFALFIGVIVGLMAEPIPSAAVGLVGVTLAGILGLVEPKPVNAIRWTLSGFSNTTVWVIFAAFMFALGYEKTGLGRRVALTLVKFLGGKTLGLGYAITFSDLILAPFTPSNTSRSAGTIYPIIRNIPELYGSQPGKTARKIGSYLMWTALAATCVTTSMFSTALSSNLLALALIKNTANLEITWIQWFMAALPVGVVLLILFPILVYKIYPPRAKTARGFHPRLRGNCRKWAKLNRKRSEWRPRSFLPWYYGYLEGILSTRRWSPWSSSA